jgi:hypothetical protein
MTNKRLGLAAALVVAAGLFWSKMLIAPPVTQAAISHGLNVHQLTPNTPKDLPSFDDRYQRHLGVLDVLNVP